MLGGALGLAALAGIRAPGFLPQAFAQAQSQAKPAQAFLSVAEDIPLMPGLIENRDIATQFDKPEGRISSAEAGGALQRRAVSAFYAAALPQLGWQALGPDTYGREAETLSLGYEGRDGVALVVHFEIKPR